MEDAYQTACCIRGYHVYRDIWAAAVGEALACEQEPRNSCKEGRDSDRALTQEDVACLLALPEKRRDIHCTVTGRRQHSSDLPQGGLEIPFIIEFRHSAKPKEIAKLKKLLYAPRFSLPFFVAFRTSLLASATATEGRDEESCPLGSGSPSTGLKKRNRGIFTTRPTTTRVDSTTIINFSPF